MEETVTGCLGAEAEIGIRISSAQQLGIFRKTQKEPRDILIKLPDWPTKQAILDIFRDPPGVEVVGVQLSVYPDLSKITIWKRKN